jgi:uncharacterized membrane protein YagU involved in acid resistance
MSTTRVAKGAIAGAIGGLAGTWAMSHFIEKQNSNRHYAIGAAMGGLYGAFYEISPATRQMGGAAFGTAIWATMDETAVLRLSVPATEHPPEHHARAFAGHMVFGVTTEIVRRGVRALLNGERVRPA